MVFIKKYLNVIILLWVGLIPLFPLFHSGIPLTHDGRDHVARIANFYLSLSEGNIIPRWATNLNWGYGHPILMFLYPLPSYISSFFHFIGFSFVDSVKLTFGTTYILSGIAMYLWMRNILGERAGFIAGVLYMYAPYRFVDLYVRGAIGEHVAFLFAPLVFYFLLKISNKFSYWYFLGGALSVAGLFLSHNALALMFFPIAFLYAIYLIWNVSYKKKLIFVLLCIFAVGIGLSSFFLLPAFLEGRYTLRDIVTGSGEYKQGFLSIYDFINFSWSYGGSSYLSKQIGIIQIVAVILGTMVLIISKKKPQLTLFFILFASFIISLGLMLPFSNLVWEKVSIIQKFQFPWRLLSVVVFTTASLASFIFLGNKNDKRLTILSVFICILVIFLYFPYYKAQGYIIKPENFYTGIYNSTTDTGESSPIWSVRFMEHSATSAADVIEGVATIKATDRNSTTREYKINVESAEARVKENTLYFPNWQVLVDGNPTTIEFQDRQYRGLITYYVPKGEHTIVIKFFNTAKRTIANTVTIFSLFAIIILYFLVRNKKIKKLLKYK